MLCTSLFYLNIEYDISFNDNSQNIVQFPKINNKNDRVLFINKVFNFSYTKNRKQYYDNPRMMINHVKVFLKKKKSFLI